MKLPDHLWDQTKIYFIKAILTLICFMLQAFVDNSHGQKIKISVFDEDKASDDESLGT